MSTSSGERGRRSVAYYRISWGLAQGVTALLILLGKQIIYRAPPQGALRIWLRAMVSENTVIDQIRASSIHLFGISFRVFDAAWLLLLLAVLNVLFGWLILRSPYYARLIGMIVFGIGFFIGVGSIMMHPTLVRVILTALDLLFFVYFAWILPKTLLPATSETAPVSLVDKKAEDA